MNIFEYATRNKFRFESKLGAITVEDLWALSLIGLDECYKLATKKLEEINSNKNSLLGTKTNQENDLDIKVQIITHIFTTKKDEMELAKQAKEKKEELLQLNRILETKKALANENLSEEELLAKIAKLKSEIK